jgi:PIN domain nuclease of toxin-antitoxin system
LGDVEVIVLDTHTWIWWVDGNSRLKREVRQQIDADSDIRICAISFLEIASAAALKRLILRPSVEQWLEVAQSVNSLRVEALTASLWRWRANLPRRFVPPMRNYSRTRM